TGLGIGTAFEAENGARVKHNTDLIVSAVGADALAPTGVRSVLPSSVYKTLTPLFGLNRGMLAATPDLSILVASTPLSTDPNFRDLIKTAYTALPSENHVIAGIGVGRLSGEAIAGVVEQAESSSSAGASAVSSPTTRR